jgi:hypothetical protein
VNLDISDYDKRSVGHLAACEGHLNILEFLATETNFNFELKDRVGHKVLDQCKFPEHKAVVEKILHAKKDLVKELAELEKRCAEIKAQLAERAEKEQK